MNFPLKIMQLLINESQLQKLYLLDLTENTICQLNLILAGWITFFISELSYHVINFSFKFWPIDTHFKLLQNSFEQLSVWVDSSLRI